MSVKSITVYFFSRGEDPWLRFIIEYADGDVVTQETEFDCPSIKLRFDEEERDATPVFVGRA